MAAAQKVLSCSAKAVTGMTADRVTIHGHDSYPRATPAPSWARLCGTDAVGI